MEITVKYRCMFTGHEDTVVLRGDIANAFFYSTHKSSLIERLESVDSTEVQVVAFNIK
jgi:hypothetical protein